MEIDDKEKKGKGKENMTGVRSRVRMKGRVDVGKMGEEAACRKLEEMGHTVVARNWRAGHLEVDIISVHLDGIHFVEVKSRVAPVSAKPEENVTALKQRRIVAAANSFLHSGAKENFADMDVYFDVISVIFEGGRAEVTYFPQAYIPLYI